MASTQQFWKVGLWPYIPTAVLGLALATPLLMCVGVPCAPLGLRYGIWLDQCPATQVRLKVNVQGQGLARGVEGRIILEQQALWLEGDGDDATMRDAKFARGSRVDVRLLDSEGAPVEGLKLGSWHRGWSPYADLTLPDVPDGDYSLEVAVETGFDAQKLSLPLSLYKPSIVYTMTDRPLYKPGQDVLFRAVVFTRDGLKPIGARPGRWQVIAPDGTEMMLERSSTDDWGISAATLPLDHAAPEGQWTVRFISGAERDEVHFEVRPFQLPRTEAEISPKQTWFRAGDDLVLRGTAKTTAGAPIVNGAVRVRLGVSEGRWPMPLSWEEPKLTKTKADGTFEVSFGVVPMDLMELSELRASADVTDETGARTLASTKVVLSQDDLKIDVLTELNGGLVEGMNNRAYLRVMQPDGTPLREAGLSLVSAFDSTRPAFEAETDIDGVAAIQLDPGAPFTVVVPAAPVRPRPVAAASASLARAGEGVGLRALDLAERRALDALLPAITACGDFSVGGSADVVVGLLADGRGVPTAVSADADGLLGRCVERVASGLRLPAGSARSYQLGWSVPDSGRPSLNVRNQPLAGQQVGGAVSAALELAAVAARPCLAPFQGESGADLMRVQWQTSEGSSRLVSSVQAVYDGGLPASARACVNRAFGALSLDEPATARGLGVAEISLSVPVPPGQMRSHATTKSGYAFAASARAGGKVVGRTKVIFDAGTIPPLRLRATPSLARGGEEVEVELIRGPGFRGGLPVELELRAGDVVLSKADFDEETKRVRFTVPKEARGFLHVSWQDARAVIFAVDPQPLGLTLSTEQEVYRPGQTAKLTVRTTAGDQPVSAAVGLVGVDKALGQLAPLLAADDMGRVTVRTTGTSAFGSFDARALALGQIRGENAAKAALLGVTELPMDAAGDQRISVGGDAQPPFVDLMSASFERAYGEAADQVRTWEKSAPASERMTPKRMAAIWKASLAALAARNEPVVDGFGRTLSLDVLPNPLLVQIDPRRMVSDATRLPEDVEDWVRFVEQGGGE